MERGRGPTVKDVAQHAGVSSGVVSRVVNGTGAVSERTRKRVLASIRALNYRPHSAARQLRTRTTNTIGLVLADVANPFFSHLADRIVQHAAELGFGVLLTTTQEDPEMERRSIELLMEKRVRGVIAAPGSANASAWRQMRDLGVDLTFIDRILPRVPGVDVVGMANENAAHTATTFLLEQGHRRIALISGPVAISTGRERLAGYRRALADNAIDDDAGLVGELTFRSEETHHLIRGLLEQQPRPTALLVGNTAVSGNVIQCLRQSQVNIPADLSVIVFHDAPWTALMTPPLTVVRHQLDALALRAVEMLHTRMDAETPRRRQEARLPSELIVRDSVTAPRHTRSHS